MEIERVFAVIADERNYQDEMTAHPDRPDMIPDLHVGDTLAAIQLNINRALESWYMGAVPHEQTMEYLRKVAALCVRAGEVYGMPVRKR